MGHEASGDVHQTLAIMRPAQAGEISFNDELKPSTARVSPCRYAVGPVSSRSMSSRNSAASRRSVSPESRSAPFKSDQ